MTLATKAELRTNVGRWLSRSTDSDFLARFDSFLALAEADFGTKLKSKVQERRLVATLNERWENNPAGSQEVRSVAILTNGNYRSRGPLDLLSYQQAVAKYGPNASGEVQAYVLVGQQIGFFPFADEDLTSTKQFEMVAYVRPDALVADTDNNEVLVSYPAVYLYGTLLQAAPYYGRQEDVTTWDALYAQAIEDANAEKASRAGDVMLERIA